MRVHLVWPAGIADLAAPSGGNVYDRRVSAGLSSLGWDVREILAGGDWPRPDASARAELQTVFSTLFKRFPGLRLAVPFEKIVFKPDHFVYGVDALPIAW